MHAKFQKFSRRRGKKGIFIFKEHSGILEDNSKIPGIFQEFQE